WPPPATTPWPRAPTPMPCAWHAASRPRSCRAATCASASTTWPWSRSATNTGCRGCAAERRLPLDDRHHAHPAGGADGDQRAATAAFGQLPGRGSDNPRPGGGKGMAGGQRGADEVDPVRIDPPQRRVQPHPVAAVVLAFPCTQGAQHLRGEGLVDLVDVEVLQAQALTRQHL